MAQSIEEDSGTEDERIECSRRIIRQVDRLNELEGYARSAAYQGVGRAFYFLFMDDHDALIEHAAKLERRPR